MTLQILFEEKAINEAAAFLADDAAGLSQLLDAIDALAENPRPTRSFPYLSAHLRRLRLGRYRVLYRIDGDVISIGHIARGRSTR